MKKIGIENREIKRRKSEKIEKSHKNSGLRNAVLETSGWETDL